MQAKSVGEQEVVKLAMEELCKKAGFADSEGMVQRDLEFLSESIESKTGVLISLSTIKRLIHGEFSRLPQIATLNAIAVYLGYQNWQSYKSTKSREPQTITSQQEYQKEVKPIPAIQSAKVRIRDIFLVGG